MRRKNRVAAAATALVVMGTCWTAAAESVAPANPRLTPAARRLLDYLAACEGQRTLVGAVDGAKFAQTNGPLPAIRTFDACGWSAPPWGKEYQRILDRTIDDAIAWHRRGGIVAMQWHWTHPANPDGSAWLKAHGRRGASPPLDFAVALAEGTLPRAALHRDLQKTADALMRLKRANVPVLWRPLHEIEGGWFWWTDRERPQNSAALWRVMFDEFVHERELDNLIWVYSMAAHVGGAGPDPRQIELRRQFYPGAQYVDVAAIDIYPLPYYGWGAPEEEGYARAYEIVGEVAPGKPRALSEAARLPNPDKMHDAGAVWAYALQWWSKQPTAFAGDERYVTLDELPDLKPPDPNRIGPSSRVRQESSGGTP